MWCFWLIIAGIFFVMEIATAGFLVFWLGIGALLAMLVSFFTSNLIIQTIVFVVSSTILIIFTKPIIGKYMSKNTTLTNAYSLLNKEGIVIVAIDGDNSVGQVKVNGEVWSAKSEGNIPIPQNTKVEVLKIDGVKLVVKPIKEMSTI